MHSSQDHPFTYSILMSGETLAQYHNHITRRLSSMKGQYADGAAFAAMLSQEDVLVYEVYEIVRPEVTGEMMTGLSIVHPGRVGEECFMTKGHFHAVLETAEIYHCLAGEGVMVMETPEGEWAVESLRPGTVLYIPPRWAHRSVNTGKTEDLVTFFAYPGHAGHDYGTIENHGFRKRILEHDNGMQIVDNPRWRLPEER